MMMCTEQEELSVPLHGRAARKSVPCAFEPKRKKAYLEKQAGPVFIMPNMVLLMCRFLASYLPQVLLSLQSIPCRFSQPPMSSASSAHSRASRIPVG